MTNLILAFDGDATSAFGKDELQTAVEIARIGCWGAKIQKPIFGHTYPGTTEVLHSLGYKVILDWKLTEISNSVDRLLCWAQSVGIDFNTCRTDEESQFGLEDALKKNRSRAERIIGVALFSSLTNKMLVERTGKTREDIIVPRIKWSHAQGIRRFVTPGEDVGIYKEYAPGSELFLVGMRAEKIKGDDQKLAVTPEIVEKLGVFATIFGRPVTTEDDPVAAFRRCSDLIKAAANP